MMKCEDLQRDVGFCSGQCKICEIKKQEERRCGTCVSYIGKYHECDNPEVPQGIADFVVGESGKDCEFWEAMEEERE